MKSVRKPSTLILLLLAGSGYLLPMVPRPVARESLAASIIKYGSLGTGAATLALALAQRQLPSLRTFAKTGAVAFALAALYKSPALVRSLLSQGQESLVPSLRRQEEVMGEIGEQQQRKIPAAIMSIIGSYSDFAFDREIRVIPSNQINDHVIDSAVFSDHDTKITIVLRPYVEVHSPTYNSFAIKSWNITTGKHVTDSDVVRFFKSSIDALSDISVKNKIAYFAEKQMMVLDLAITRVGRELNLPEPASIAIANFSSDGTKLVGGGFVGTKLFIWNVESLSSDSPSIVESKESIRGLVDVNFSTRGDKIITGDGRGTVCVFHSVTGQEEVSIPSQSDYKYAIVQARFNSDDTKIVALDSSGFVWIRNAQTQQVLHSYHGCSSVCFSPEDPELLVAGFKDGTVKVFDITRKDPIQILRGHAKEVSFVNFNSAGNKIVTASKDGIVRIWSQPFAQPKKGENKVKMLMKKLKGLNSKIPENEQERLKNLIQYLEEKESSIGQGTLIYIAEEIARLQKQVTPAP